MNVVWILVFLLLSALFTGAEIAFLSANKLLIELKKKRGSPQSSILSRFYDDPSAFIGAMLVGSNIALVVFSVLMTVPLNNYFKGYLGWTNDVLLLLLNTAIISAILLIFGEFLPKSLFRLFPDKAIFFLAYPLTVLYWILRPPAWIITRLAHFIIALFSRSPVVEVKDVLTRLDLENFIKSTRTESNDEIDTELFEKALNLSEVRVKESMVPRPEIEAIDATASIDELIGVFRKTNLSRIIVYENDIDNVLGYVHHQQLLKPSQSIRDMVMEIAFFPETMRVPDLMNQFIKNRMNIACVVDEYGGTAGIITMEDILEEIFGEIEDEHDEEDFTDQQVSDTEFVFSGRLEIAFLNEKYPQLRLPEGEYHTLSGYLVMTVAHIPSAGEEILLDGKKFILESVSDTKVETVRVILLQEDSPS